MDKETRGAIERATQKARRLLEAEFREQLEGMYDVLPSGQFPENGGGHLSARERLTREKIAALVNHKRAAGMKPAEAVDDYVRDAAFTTLNRFVALKMLEERELVQRCVSEGDQSNGFKEFCMLAPGMALLPDGRGYRLYIECVFDELSREVKVLFDRRDVAAALWPRRAALAALLDALNAQELAGVWRQDETIGWVYQYFNSDADRESARYDADGKPRPPENSRDLAVRNQFFTPRYVVEFLADNTLGRTWFEMQQGQTILRDRTYFVWAKDDPIPARQKKDPRDLRIIDPACGSGHFLLYSFDLLIAIYEEAWEDAASPVFSVTGRTLRDDYPDEASLQRELPGQILRYNLHGVDIDARCAQIAALALWMRAQRAFQEFRIERDARPPITRTNIVVAEPMPGEKEMVEEFAAALKPAVLGDLFRALVERMRLAGELGSLLKIEVALEDDIKKARQAFEGLKRKTLSFEFAKPQGAGQAALDFTDLADATFFDRAEELILEALNRYVESVNGIQETRRRLFADDAQQGLALMHLLQQRYDVLLMNPPFGDASVNTKEYLEDHYPSSRQDIFAMFVERAAADLVPAGAIGLISTDAGFYRRTLEPWRREVLLARCTTSVMVHLGGHVLDGATVRVAAYVLETPRRTESSLFLRCFEKGGPSQEPLLAASLVAIRRSGGGPAVFRVDQSEFEKLPYAVFGYWCSPELRNAFVDLPSLEGGTGHVRQGLATADDFRFLRLKWEVASLVGLHGWVPFAKGGEHSPYHDDVHLLVDWQNGRGALDAFDGSVIRNPGDYMKPGLTYPLRTAKRFAPRTLPIGCAFGHKGPAIVDVKGDVWALAALLNSRTVAYLLSMGLGMTEAERGGAGANSYEVGLVQRLPMSENATMDPALASLGARAWRTRAQADLRDETTALFRSPLSTTSQINLSTTLRQAWTTIVADDKRDIAEYVELQEAIDRRTRELYRLGDSDWNDIVQNVGDVHRPDVDDSGVALREFAGRFVEFLVGCAFGRWNPATLRQPGAVADPAKAFNSLVVHAEDNLEGPSVLVDDPGHTQDMIPFLIDSLVRGGALDPAGILTEAATALGCKGGDLREWLRDGFFDAHRRHYSKSRRQAPIYWQLATASGGYSVWLYYHRLRRDTLYTVLNDYVGPKVQHEERKLEALRSDHGPNPTNSQRKDSEAQERFVEELRVFREEVARVAPMWSPNLDDGVIINFSPLWRLVPQNRDWQKECKHCWDELASEENAWSHLAMHLWPERIVPKCRTDRSLAITHGLEEVFWAEDDKGKRTARPIPGRDPQEIVSERTSPAVKAALSSLLGAAAPIGKAKARGRGAPKAAPGTQAEK
jgi:hypothetical protein